MTMILDLLRDAFEDAKLPPSFYEAKKTISKLGLDYIKIPACPNNCMLYWEGDSELEACKHCGTSKWNPNKKKKQVAKVLRYFPLKPRLQRLFMCGKTAEHMRWHASGNNAGGLMRHPRDGEAWKTFDQTHSGFVSDPRNIRLGLASDDFNPFGTMSTTYSICPVFLIPYNLPPWMCMKHTSFILSMIIPGKHMPGNNIDVMHAALMWTISDFPGLGILSGWNTHTGFACPTCNFDTEPYRLCHSKEWCFMGHRSFLRRNHRALSSKTLNVSELDKLQERIESTLFHLEILFPLAFFTVMVHLSVHLAGEAKLGGPVHHRNMYPVERELGHFKSFVQNKAQPEGSIAEGYLVEESLTFCSRYIEDIETRFNRPRRVRDEPNVTEPSGTSSIFPQFGKPASASIIFPLTDMQKLQAHRYVLLNCAIVMPFVDEFRQYIRRSSRKRPSPTEIERKVNKEFVDWFQKRIMNPDTIDTMSIDLKFLARGPSVVARSFTTYNINRSKFRTLAREEGLRTQNSGVFLTSKTSCVASSIDENLRQAELPYYGKLEDILEINYYGRFKVVLFKCRWADTALDKGYKKDRWNLNCVNFDRLIHTSEREENEPYIEASQAQMVYYVDDGANKGWSVAMHLKPRDLYDMGEEVVEDEVYENEPYQEQELEQFFGDGDEYVQLATDHIIDDVVETNVATN
ncbi:uncharacterized protein [Nicotiana sylvestris]|uniref:uncharacterized protein n=1 Tax=Nicotiana sylvestris TaxID=4096 RepID=UPI00388CA40A